MTMPSTIPLLSIVIPTKNRCDTLFPTIEAIIGNIIDARLEVIIQDNSDNEFLAHDYFSKHPDLRIKYHHTKGVLSVVENTELALSRATGEYITFIGDDDFINPLIMNYVEDFSIRKVDSIIYPSAYYWWKSVQFKLNTKFYQPGAFWYPEATDSSERKINTKKELQRVMSQGAVGLYQLPRVYHGVVRRTVLESIKSRVTKYVNGASPDMALAIATALIVDQHIVINTPLTIYGASKNSGGGWTASKKHYGKIADQKHLPQQTKDNWNTNLPLIWSEFTIYPQTALEVTEAFRCGPKLNLTAFYASMAIYEPHLMRYIAPVAIKYLIKNPLQIFHLIFIASKKSLGRLRRAFRSRVIGLDFSLKFFDTPNECMRYLSDTTSKLRK